MFPKHSAGSGLPEARAWSLCRREKCRQPRGKPRAPSQVGREGAYPSAGPPRVQREADTPGEAQPQAPSSSQMWVPPLVYLERHLPLPALHAIRSSRCQLRRLCKSHAEELGCFRLSPASTPAPRPGSRPGPGVCFPAGAVQGPRSPSARGQGTSWEHLIGAPEPQHSELAWPLTPVSLGCSE